MHLYRDQVFPIPHGLPAESQTANLCIACRLFDNMWRDTGSPASTLRPQVPCVMLRNPCLKEKSNRFHRERERERAAQSPRLPLPLYLALYISLFYSLFMSLQSDALLSHCDACRSLNSLIRAAESVSDPVF